MRPILQAIFLKYCGKSDAGDAATTSDRGGNVQADDPMSDLVNTGKQLYQMSFSQWRMLLRHAGLLGYRGLSPAAALTVFRLSTVPHVSTWVVLEQARFFCFSIHLRHPTIAAVRNPFIAQMPPGKCWRSLSVWRCSCCMSRTFSKKVEDSSFAGDFMSFKGFVEGFFRCMLYIQYPSADEMVRCIRISLALCFGSVQQAQRFESRCDFVCPRSRTLRCAARWWW